MQSATALTTLPTVVTLMIALSVATERLVEIIKGWFPWLDQAKELAAIEGRRRAALQLLAVGGGILVSYLAWPISSQIVPADPEGGPRLTVLALGLLASGGSGFWNSILSYVISVKDLKTADAKLAKQGAVGAQPVPQPADGLLKPS